MFEESAPGRSKASFPSLSRKQMELLLPVVAGCPEYVCEQAALPGGAGAGGRGRAPGGRVLLFPAAGLVPGPAHTPAPGPRVQPEQGRFHRGRQDHRGICFSLWPCWERVACAFNPWPQTEAFVISAVRQGSDFTCAVAEAT